MLLFCRICTSKGVKISGPLGCLSRTLADIHNNLSKLDEHGCVVSYNRASQTLNLHLKNVCQQLREHFSDATIVYINIYSIKYALIENASEYGTHIKNIELIFFLIYGPSLKITLWSGLFLAWNEIGDIIKKCTKISQIFNNIAEMYRRCNHKHRDTIIHDFY